MHSKLVSESSGKIYKIGMKVNVKVVSVDIDQRKVDFNLVKQST